MTYSYLLRSTPLPRKIAHYTFLEGTFLNFLVSKPQLREMVENHMEVQKEKARITMRVRRLWKSLTCEHQILEVAGLGREVAEVNVADMLRKAWVRFDEARS